MADLPETEIVRRALADRLTGAVVTSAEGVDGTLVGDALAEIGRHGRVLVLGFGTKRLLLSMRRPARVWLSPEVPPPRYRVRLAFEDGNQLYYQDATAAPRFGVVGGGDQAAWARLAGKGLEPLSGAFTLGAFKRILEKRKRSVKFALGEDGLVAGLGHVYPDEMLHLAGIRPDREAASLSEDEKRDLYFAIFQVLHKAIRFGGLPGNGYTVEGPAGGYERFLAVSRRQGQRCPACNGRVRQIGIVRRQAWFCPRCQH